MSTQTPAPGTTARTVIKDSLEYIHQQLNHLHEQLQGDLNSEQVKQFQANLKAEVDRIKSLAQNAAGIISQEIENAVAHAIRQTPAPATPASSTPPPAAAAGTPASAPKPPTA